MIGLVLVAHGDLGAEFLKALEHIVGPQAQAYSIRIGVEDDMEARRREIAAAITAADTGQGVVLLTDMFGGTPSNLAISVMRPGHVEVVAGVNLPMLLKLAGVRGQATLASAVSDAQDAGRKYIHIASRLLDGGVR
ncbi:MAG: PTS sugar transporter subunit IIA [Alphaproteobacteria bacterium]